MKYESLRLKSFKPKTTVEIKIGNPINGGCGLVAPKKDLKFLKKSI